MLARETEVRLWKKSQVEAAGDANMEESYAFHKLMDKKGRQATLLMSRESWDAAFVRTQGGFFKAVRRSRAPKKNTPRLYGYDWAIPPTTWSHLWTAATCRP